MKTRIAARIWVYRNVVAGSLRKHAADARMLPRCDLTEAQRRRVQSEMLRLAGQLELKAAKLENKPAHEDRCQHGMFYSGAGACPQCGKGAA